MTDPFPPDNDPAASSATLAEAPAHNRVLLPVRGLVCAHNRRGRPLAERDLARWLHLNRTLHKTEKCDVLVHGPVPPLVASLLRRGEGTGSLEQSALMPLSLRTNCPESIPDLSALKADGMLDVLLCPPDAAAPGFRAWLDAAAAAEIPARVQVQPPLDAALEPASLAKALADAGVPVLTIVNDDPFQPRAPCADETDAHRTIDAMNALAEAAQAAGLEVNLYGLPLGFVSKENLGIAGGRRRFYLDHQQYQKASHEWACRLHRASPRMAALGIAAYLGRFTAVRNLPDEVILRWVIEGDRRALFQALAVAAKFVRRWRLWPLRPEQRVRYEEDLIASIARLKENGYGALGPEFDSLRVPSDESHAAEDRAFERLMPGVRVETAPPDTPSIWNGLGAQHKHHDAIDAARLDDDDTTQRLAAEANRIVQSTPPDIERSQEDIRPENAFGVEMPGAYRWHTLLDREVLSLPLHEGDLPFTVQITVGGGIADFAGFSIWDAIKVVCPMQAYSHVLVLHAGEDGRFVLLRDGIPVAPVQFEGQFHTPRRLPTTNEVRASLWNIDTGVSVQAPRIWTGPRESASNGKAIRHSVLIVSTRYARRLQAVLTAIAHQVGVPADSIEVIVGFVPGIDATEDVLNSLEAVFPDLRIVRSPFPERRMRAKGFIINQSLKLARGEWVTLLDSDTLVPANLFAMLDALPADTRFAAPMGRKMLPREVTARILLGETRPWLEWDALLNGPGEERYGEKREGGDAPIGFCQCVRRECLDAVQYNEYDNFEGADWEFACAMREQFGDCHFLDAPVLHLDHGGSQWYGAQHHQ